MTVSLALGDIIFVIEGRLVIMGFGVLTSRVDFTGIDQSWQRISWCTEEGSSRAPHPAQGLRPPSSGSCSIECG